MEYSLNTTNYRTFTLVDTNTFIPADIPVSVEAVVRAKLLPGDIVKVHTDTGGAITLAERMKHPALAGYIDLMSKTIHGMSSRGTPQFIFYPLNRAYPPMIVGYAAPRNENKIVVVRFDHWTDKFPHGALERIIGAAGDKDAEREALIVAASPWREVKINSPIHVPITAPCREKISKDYDWRTFNVDPDGCRDIDDVFSYRPVEYNRAATIHDIYEVAISIADVAACVQDGSMLDFSACDRGQTLYADGVAVRPMLPVQISEDICSLVAGKARNCISLIFEIDLVARTSQYVRFVKTVVTNDLTYTYDEIGCSSGSGDNADRQILAACADILGCTEAEDPHKWIETLMVHYNKEAAKILAGKRRGLLRCHSAGAAASTMTQYHPDLVWIGMEAAKYHALGSSDADISTLTHSMFGDDTPYCHMSSPIRRYADLVNQRELKHILYGDHAPSKNMRFIESHLNRRAAVAKKFERDMFFLNVLYSDCDEGQTLDGVCIECDDTGAKIKVYIPAWKRVVTIRDYDGAIAGDWVRISYYFDALQTRWKDKIIFRCDEVVA